MTASIFGSAADLLDPPYRTDPVGWVQNVARDYVWSTQRAILEAVRDHRRVAVPSCHLGGKSFTASRAVGWWIDQHAPGEAFAVTTAPTGPQVDAILWKEIRRMHTKAKLRGRALTREWKVGPGSGELVALGRKPNDYEPTAFQGLHERYVLAVLDEAGGIYGELWDAIDSLTGNDGSRILAIGNPDDPGSHFASICRPNSGWHVIHLDGYETPSMTGEEVPEYLRGLLISPTWIEEKRVEWGEDSAMFQAKVRGKFPDMTRTGVVPYAWANRCKVEGAWGMAAVQRAVSTLTNLVELGIDVGAGGDETVIYARRGPAVLRAPWIDHSGDWERVVDLAIEAILEVDARRVKVDVIGIGWGVVGGLEAARKAGRHSAEIIGVNVAESSADPSKFPNLRSEVWWMMRDLARQGALDLRLVEDETIYQLTAPEYKIVGGRTVVEPKAETRKRLRRSPDRADALNLAYYSPPPKGFAIVGGTHHHGAAGDAQRRSGATRERRGGGWRDPRGE